MLILDGGTGRELARAAVEHHTQNAGGLSRPPAMHGLPTPGERPGPAW